MWLSKAVEVNAKERNKQLSLQESSPPSWIFDRPEFVSWLDAPTADNSRNLWLFGTPGFGKSVLAAYLTEEIPRRFELTTAYFFCKDGQLTNSADQITRTILYQLTKDSTSTYANVKDLWNADRSFADGTPKFQGSEQM